MEYVFQENDRGVKISGELVFTDYRDFRALWGRLLNTKSGQSVTIDLSELQFIDSAGLGMLLIVRDEAARAEISLVLKNPQGQVKRIFAISRFDTLFSILH